MKAVAYFPKVLVDSFKPDGLFGEDFRDIEELAPPLDLAVVTHLPDLDAGLVVHRREFARIGARGEPYQ